MGASNHTALPQRGRAIIHRLCQWGQAIIQRLPQQGRAIIQRLTQRGRAIIQQRLPQQGRGIIQRLTQRGRVIIKRFTQRGRVITQRLTQRGRAIIQRLPQRGRAIIQRFTQRGRAITQRLTQRGRAIIQRLPQRGTAIIQRLPLSHTTNVQTPQFFSELLFIALSNINITDLRKWNVFVCISISFPVCRPLGDDPSGVRTTPHIPAYNSAHKLLSHFSVTLFSRTNTVLAFGYKAEMAHWPDLRRWRTVKSTPVLLSFSLPSSHYADWAMRVININWR